MFHKHIQISIQNLSNEVTRLNYDNKNQQKVIKQLNTNVDSLLNNQQLLFMLNKKLADCFQLEWDDGKYVSKRGIRNTK